MSSTDWMNKDFYKVLGLSKDATADEIKKSYRKLARANHPDAHPDDPRADGRFKEISEAYSVLSDPAKRKEYDEQRALFGGGGVRFPRGGGGFDVGDLFGQGGAGGGGLGDLLGGIFNTSRGRTTTSQPRRGADVETEASLEFPDLR